MTHRPVPSADLACDVGSVARTGNLVYAEGQPAFALETGAI
jgi:hypothetical protein